MKGQLQIQETILVIFIITVLIGVGLLFFFKFTKISLDNDAFDYEESKFNSLISVIPSMPEFRCSNLNIESECMDVSKINSFDRIANNYEGIFEFKKISVEEILLDPFDVVIYDKQLINKKKTLVISSPVSLYYPDEDRYGIGKLEIEWYQ